MSPALCESHNELAFCCERSNKTRSRSERYRNYPRCARRSRPCG
jgi:hypothetical protein